MRRIAVAVVLAGVLASSQALAEGYHYQPGLHADPFKAPQAAPAVDESCNGQACIDPMELKLTAIVSGSSTPVAMIENSKGEATILKTGDFVGRHRVEAIRSDRVIFTETRITASGPVKVSRELKL